MRTVKTVAPGTLPWWHRSTRRLEHTHQEAARALASVALAMKQIDCAWSAIEYCDSMEREFHAQTGMCIAEAGLVWALVREFARLWLADIYAARGLAQPDGQLGEWAFLEAFPPLRCAIAFAWFMRKYPQKIPWPGKIAAMAMNAGPIVRQAAQALEMLPKNREAWTMSQWETFRDAEHLAISVAIGMDYPQNSLADILNEMIALCQGSTHNPNPAPATKPAASRVSQLAQYREARKANVLAFNTGAKIARG